MRIVHVIDSLAPAGGAENRLVDEVLALGELDAGFEQAVIHLFAADGLAPRLQDAGVPVSGLGFSSGRAGRTWPLMAYRLWQELRRIEPDCVHTSLFSGNLVGQLAAAPLGVPVVSTFNRTGELKLQRALQAGVASWRGRVMQAVGRWSARRGDVHYRSVGSYARSTNCRLMGMPLERSSVIPRGVRLAPGDREGDRARFGLPADGPLFVNVARRTPEKGQHLLVEAFARVREKVPEAHLAIAGAAGQADKAVMAAVSRHGVEDSVWLLGHRDDARRLVASADVFVFSSLSEGSPGAVVEALMLEAPVAAFAIPPVVELTGREHAWLAEPGEVTELADAMLAAHAASSGREREATRAWAARYELNAVAAQLGDLLVSRVAGQQGRKRRRSADPQAGTTGSTGAQP